MALMVDNSKTYLRPMDEREIKDFWSKLEANQLTGVIWREGQTKPYQLSKLKLEANSVIEINTDDDFSYKTLKGEFNGLTAFMKFRLSEEIQFFAAGAFTLAGSTGMQVQLRPPFFITTKRSTCRYITTPTDRISMKVAGHDFDCFDISSGGFSTEVNRSDYGGLNKGDVFQEVVLKYNLKSFTIPTVKLVNIIDVLGRPDRVKLAFKFEELKSSIEDALWVEVNKSIKKMVDLMG